MLQANEALLLLGGDIGDVRNTLGRAIVALQKDVGTVLARSRDHWTRPWGFEGNSLFLNKAILLRTELGPEELIDVILRVEVDLGRVRTEAPGYASRPVDIDILLIGDRVLNGASLSLPHPRMHLRSFALAPAADIAPEAVHPLLGRSVLELLDDLRASF